MGRRRHRDALRAAKEELASALGDVETRPDDSNRNPPEHHTTSPQQRRTPSTESTTRGKFRRAGWWLTGWVLGAAGVWVAVGLGASTFGHPTDVRFIAGGTAATVCGVAIASGRRPESPGRMLRWTPRLLVLLTILFVTGAFNSVIIDGRPVLAISTEARAHRMVLDMESDLLALVEADRLLSLPIAEARARSRDFERLADQMKSMSAKWSTTELSSLPTGEFAPVGTSLASAAFAAVQATEAKISLLGSSDARVTAELNAARQNLQAEVLSAGPQLVALGQLYGADVRLGSPSVRE